jgi:signal transduction histidine kinase
MADPELRPQGAVESANGNHNGENNHVRGDLNLRIIRSLCRFVEETYGSEKLDALSWEAGVPVEQLRSCRGWISQEQAEAIMHRVHSWVGSDQAFMKACIHRMKDSYGPLRFLLWATSPDRMLEMGQNHFSSISSFSRGDFEKIGDNRFRLRYYSTRKESRLLCLSRQAQSEALPELWDLPAANLREASCICNGDDHCEYILTIYEKSRWLPVLIGALAGACASVAVSMWNIGPMLLNAFIWGMTPILGASAGFIWELLRANRRNLMVADDINRGLSQLVVENQEAQQEILSLHHRQRAWNRRLEEQVAERTRNSEQLAKRLQSILTERTSALKGVSHDMKNPLTVMLQTSEVIGEKLDFDSLWLVEEQKLAVDRMRGLLDDVLQLQTSDPADTQFLPEPVETAPLEESFRRRLRALVGDRGIRVSVIATRERPEWILIDRMVLDRVVDNLLTNAVKYTERGSIVLELDGKPGFLTIKLSDTGRGIAEEHIQMIFQAGGSDPMMRSRNSHGMGLSVVVRLLDSIGGKLEVMSLPGRGSTFWVHFPVEPSGISSVRETAEPSEFDLAHRVVTIRRVV